MDEGWSVSDYANKEGVSQSVMSRRRSDQFGDEFRCWHFLARCLT